MMRVEMSSKSEHITALFVGGLYYWFAKNDRQSADLCWRTAVDILENCLFIEVIGVA